LEETIKTVKEWKGKEGIVISYNDNQNRIKIKSDWYCWIHKIKSQLNSESNLIEYYVNEGLPSYKKFYETIKNNFDWELAEQMTSEISKMVDCGKKVKKNIKGMESFINTIKHYPTRKEQAQQIIASYSGETNRSSMLFTLLDGKKLSNDQLIKLMHQNL
jgi:predicted CopG family antitoxin